MTETKKKSVREKRIPGTLPLTTLSVLRRVVNGEALLATRRFPYNWEYRFDAQGTKVGIMAISALIEGGYLTATQSDPCADYIAYFATAEGKRYAKDGPLPPDDPQLDLIEGVA